MSARRHVRVGAPSPRLRRRNILLTGRPRAGLVRAFHHALRRAGGGGVIVAGPDKLAPVAAEASRAFRVPASETEDFADEILSVAIAEDVALVVPASPEGIRPLADAASRFLRADIRIAVSPADTIAICRDQYQVGRSLGRLWIPTIETYLPQQLPPSPAFPLVVRPRYGSSDGSVFVARDMTDLAFFLNYVGEPVVHPFVDGPEFAVDVVCGTDGTPLSIAPRDRFSPSAVGLAARCVAALPFVGALTIFYRIVDGRHVITGIDPLLGDGVPLAGRSGRTVPERLTGIVWGRSPHPRPERRFARPAFKSFVPQPISPSMALSGLI